MMSDELTVLGRSVRAPLRRLETILVPSAVKQVTFRGDELTANCPVTGQPDFYDYEIHCHTHSRSLESKSLKLYLWSWHDEGIFAETLAAHIADDVAHAIEGRSYVRLDQHVRGGISLSVIAEGGLR